MDERTLSELLECSVCLEQLNADSRVLPCQHTFCRSCLDEIVRAKKELRCPECRLLIRCRIEDLPANLLLVRLLEGLKSSEKITDGEKCSKKSLVHAARKLSHNEHANFLQSVARVSNVTGTSAFHQTSSLSLQASGSSQVVYSTVMPMSPPCIRCYALYNYKHAKDDELDLKKGDVYTIVEKCEDGWYRGSALLHPEHVGFFPGNYVLETSSSDVAIVSSASVGLDSSGGGAGLAVPSPHLGVLRAHSFPKTSPLAGADLAAATARAAKARPPTSLLIPPRPITNITQAQSRNLIGSWSPSAISVASTSQASVTTDCSIACPAPVVSLLSPMCGGGMHAAVDKRSGSSSVVEEDHHVVLRASASRRRQEQQAKMRGSESRHSAHCSLASSPGTSNGSGAIVVVETDASSSKKEDKAEGSSSSKPSLLKRLSQVGLSLTHHRPRSARAADTAPSPTQQAPGVPTSSISSPTDSRRLGPKMTTLANLLHRSSFSELSEQSTVVVPDDVTVLQHRLSGSLNFSHSKNKAAHAPVQRCQCVIPYPANSDLELDLKVGDIVAVHKMNADGWFRGTHMRTGRVGYFPASFVRSCS